MGAMVAVAAGGKVATGIAVAVAPVIGITGAGVAVGAAEPQADTTSISTRRAGNKILFFIRILLEMVLRHFHASKIDDTNFILFLFY
jgi:hypothetical protein